jgi:hypothetical protein
VNTRNISCSFAPSVQFERSWQPVCSQREHEDRGTSGIHRQAQARRSKSLYAGCLTKQACPCSQHHRTRNPALASPGMKASFSVAVWQTRDRLFLVPVGTGFGPLKTFLPRKRSASSGLMAIVAFVMHCVHISIWNC